MKMRFPSAVLAHSLIASVYLVAISAAFAQAPNPGAGPGADTPTGVAGGFGGTMEVGSGSADPYEMNFTRNVTDVVVPGSVVPFAFTRIWNSRRQAWSDNWAWRVDENDTGDQQGGGGVNGFFLGYRVYYPDGRVVTYSKPDKNGAPGDVGTYTSALGIVDRFVVQSGGTQAQLLMSDGSVVNFPVPSPPFNGSSAYASSIVDPYGLPVTISYVGADQRTITEPGGRWIKIGPTQGSGTNHQTIPLTTSLGQSVTYVLDYHTTGYYASTGGSPQQTADPYGDTILTSYGTVTYNDVLDDSGQPVQANYTYKNVQPPRLQPSPAPMPPDFDRLVWASDPMFSGPLQQVRYIYLDDPGKSGADPTDSKRDVTLSEVLEERYATSLSDAGTMVNRLEPFPWTYDQNTGYSPDFWTRKQTRGDGYARTMFYYNNDSGLGQILVDHVTDWTNSTVMERRLYDWTHYFQTPIKITDMNQHLTQQTLEPVLGHITRETHPDPQQSHRDWFYTDSNNPYYVDHVTDERGNTTTFIRDANQRVKEIDYPNTNSTAGLYPQTSYETFSYNSLGQVLTHRLTSGGTESFAYYPSNAGAKANCMKSWTNAEGKMTTYDYDNWGRLSAVTDPRGAQGDANYTTNYEYNGRHQVTKITLPSDRITGQRYTIQKAYNAQTGTLASVTDEMGHTTYYTYDEYKRVIAVKDATGQTTTTKYDPWNGSGRLALTTNMPTQIISPLGKKVYTYYDANLRKSETLQAPGTADAAATYFYYDNEGNLTSVKDPRGNVTSYGYDERNRKISATDPAPFNNQVTKWNYDYTSNMVKETRPDTKYRTLGYDERNHLIDTWGFTGEHTHYERDPAGNIGQETTCNGGVYGFSYDTMNRKKGATYPVDATGQARSEGWLYDDAGNMYQYTNPAGQIKTLAYDNRNRAYNSSWSANSGPTTDTAYDAASRMTSIKTNNGETLVSFGYDDANRQIWEEQTVSGGPTTHINTPRDNDGNRSSLNIPGGYALNYDYTQRSQLWHIGGWFTYTYDPAGNMTKRQDIFGGVNDSVTVGYDQMNRVQTWQNTAIGDVSFAVSRYSYDNLSREKSVARDEESGKGDTFGYNDRNQLTNASYDVAVPTPTPTPTATPPPPTPTPTPTPPPGQVAAPKITSSGSYPNAAKVTMSCATAGATIFYTKNGTTPTHNGGSATGNTSIYSGVITVPAGTAQYFWALGYKAGMADSAVSELLVDNTNPNNGPVSAPPSGADASDTDASDAEATDSADTDASTADGSTDAAAAGGTATDASPDASDTQAAAADPESNPIASDTQASAAAAAPDATSAAPAASGTDITGDATASDAGGTDAATVSDPTPAVSDTGPADATAASDTQATAANATTDPGTDAPDAGTPLSDSTASAQSPALAQSDVSTGGYDTSDTTQLQSQGLDQASLAATQSFAAPAARTVSYAFTNLDPLNRDSVTENGVLTNYTANKLNQYSNVGGQNPGYDGNFNLNSYNNYAYTFNAQNELVSSLGNGANVQLIYDGLGRVLKRTIKGKVTIFVYDGWKVMEELDGQGHLVAWNIYGAGPDEILWRNQSGTTLIYHTDKEGNVTYLLDGTGHGIERYTYDAFGAATIMDMAGNVKAVSAWGNSYMFNGKEYVTEIGLYDYRHRWYQPQLGRFLEIDPLGLQNEGEKLSAEQKTLYPKGEAPESFASSELNLYRYCADDPVDRIDPTGLTDIEYDQQSVSIAVTAAAGLYHMAVGGNGLKGDHQDRTQWVLSDRSGHLSLSAPLAGTVGRHFQGPELRPNHFRTEPVPDTQGKQATAAAHFHNDRHNSTQNPSPLDENTKTPMVFTSERLGEKNKGILIVPQQEKNVKPREISIDVPCIPEIVNRR